MWFDAVVMSILVILTSFVANTNELLQNFGVPKGCRCAPIGECLNNALPMQGMGTATFRLDIDAPNPCSSFNLRVCCPRDGQPSTGTGELKKPKSEPQNVRTNLNFQSKCGERKPNGFQFKIIEKSNTVTQFAEFPWMVLVFKGTRNSDGRVIKTFVGGGSLIHERVVLTAAHLVENLTTYEAGVRAGDWDTTNDNEPLAHQDLAVVQIIIHEKFDQGHFFNDIALMITEIPFKQAPNVGIVCLPKATDVILSNSCLATGWGKNMTGHRQPVLKKVDQLPIVDKTACQTKLRTWSLDYLKFEVHEGSLCAGGILNKDTCQGDGGGPLMCPIGSDMNRLQQVGITSWGLRCGSEFPAIYANVAHFRRWIDAKMEERRFVIAYNY